MYLGNKILCTICARGGSKGVPGKNIRPLHGKPMIVWTIEQAINSHLFEHIVVSTDSDKIIRIAKSAGAEVFFKRSPELSSDTVAKLPAIRDAFLRSEEHYNDKYDILVDLDASSPLRLVDDVINAVDFFLNTNFDNLITGTIARRSPYFNLVETVGNTKRVVISKKPKVPIYCRQDAPACYDMNASIYIWNRRTILECDEVLGQNTGIYVMPEERSIDVDSELSFEFVEYIFQRKLLNDINRDNHK